MFNKGCGNHTTKVNVNFKSLNLTLVAKSGSHRETNQLTGRLLRWGDRKLLSGYVYVSLILHRSAVIVTVVRVTIDLLSEKELLLQSLLVIYL